jgi:hypothetical protein
MTGRHGKVPWLKRFHRDVAAEVRAVEMDFFHGGVGGGLRSFKSSSDVDAANQNAIGVAYM